MELKCAARWDDNAVAGRDLHRFACGFIPPASPHFALSAQEVPDLLDSPVPHRPADSARLQDHFDQAGTPGVADPEIDLRAVRRDGVRPAGQSGGAAAAAAGLWRLLLLLFGLGCLCRFDTCLE